MATFHRILFPVDFSLPCEQIADAVAWLALQLHAHVTLLHVMESGKGAHPVWYALFTPDDLSSFKAACESRLSEFRRDAFAALDVERRVLQGEAAGAIVAYAKEQGIDLVMMPTRGFGPFRRMLLGSTAAKVLHDVECPVWTSAHPENAAVSRQPEIRRILCAIDLSQASVDLIKSSAELANLFGAEFSVVHAIRAMDASSSNPGVKEVNRYLRKEAESAWGRLQREADFSHQVTYLSGAVDQAIKSAVIDAHADLVMIGRSRISEPFGRLRTNAQAIIRESPCPVLSL
ncbi:MAG: universal stress protein [Bryobacteraceae bacterium]